MTTKKIVNKKEITLSGVRLERQSSTDPDVRELDEMLKALRRYLDEELFVASTWFPDIHTILEFQDEDGSFKLVDSYEIPSDVRVEYCHKPTYICAGILMKAYMSGLYVGDALAKGLAACCHRDLMGHGYDGFVSQVETLQMFMQCGLREFLKCHRELCPAFAQMMERILESYRCREKQRDFKADWERDFEQEIREINRYFSRNNVFVYGTLLQGQGNHDHYLEDDWLIGRAVADKFQMYDIGHYPGIVRGEGRVRGELYEVPAEAMEDLDILEDEGSLYIRDSILVTMESGETVPACIYIYNHDVDGLERIPEENQPYTSDRKQK